MSRFEVGSSMSQCHEQVLTSQLCGDPPLQEFEGYWDIETKTQTSPKKEARIFSHSGCTGANGVVTVVRHGCNTMAQPDKKPNIGLDALGPKWLLGLNTNHARLRTMRECQAELSALLDWNRGKLIAAALLSKARLKSLTCTVLNLVSLALDNLGGSQKQKLAG